MKLNKTDKEDIIKSINEIKIFQGEMGKKILESIRETDKRYENSFEIIDEYLEKINEYQKEMINRFNDLKDYQKEVQQEMANRFDDLKKYQVTYQKEILTNFNDLKLFQNELQLGINKNDKSTIHSLEVMASLYNALLHQITELKELYLLKNKYGEGTSEQLLARKIIKNKWKLIDRIYHEPVSVKCEICNTYFENKNAEKYMSEDIYEGGKLVRYKCPNCGVIFGPNKMLDLTEKELGEEYLLHYSIFSEGDTTVSECRTFYELKPEKGKRYLNYGCGAWSKTIEKLRADGYDVWGYEPYATTNSKYIYNNYDLVKKMKFDGIFSHDLLEHLRYPIDAFRKFYELLNEDGKMAHATACYKYVYEYTRFHLFFYTGNSIKIICDKTGFEIIDECSLPDELFYCYIYKK